MTDLHTGTGPEFAAHIGIHWADQKHFWAMRTADGKTQRGELKNAPEAIQVWAAELAQRFGGRPIAVGLEQARGAVIAKLCKYAHLVLFPIHPNTVSNYRKAFSPSGAKSDPGDGRAILELLLTHPDKFPEFSVAKRTMSASSSGAMRGRPGEVRNLEPSNLRAISRRYQAKMVSGLATQATC